MKKLSFILCLAIMLAFLFTLCKPKVDVAKEKEAIMAVINAETQALVDRDVDKIKGFFVQDEFQARMTTQCQSYTFRKGWKSINSMYDSVPVFMTGIKNYKFSKEFLSIKVMGDVAWAIYKETTTYDYNNVPTSRTGIRTMVLQKLDGKWKISCFSLSEVVPPPPPPPVPPVPPVPPAPPGKK